MAFTHPFALFSSVALLFVADLAPGLMSSVVAIPGDFVLEKNASNDLPRTRSFDDGKHEERAGVNFETVGSMLEQFEAMAAVTKEQGSVAHLFTQEPATVHGPSDDFLAFLHNCHPSSKTERPEFPVEEFKQMRRKALVSHISRLNLESLVKGMSQGAATEALQDVITKLGNQWGMTEVTIAIHLAQAERPSPRYAIPLELAQFHSWLTKDYNAIRNELMDGVRKKPAIGDEGIVDEIMKSYVSYCNMFASVSR